MPDDASPSASSDPSPASSTASPSSSPSPSASRVPASLKWTGLVLGGVVALVLGVAVLLPRLFSSEELKALVIPPIEEAVQREVTIETIGLRVLPFPSVRVDQLQIANAEGFGPEPAIEARAFHVDVALWPLFSGTIQPTAVELVAPTLRYEVAEDGTTNFDTFAAASDTTASDTTASGGGFGVAVENFRASEARILYVDRSTGQSAAVDVEAQLRAAVDGATGDVESGGTIDVPSLRAVLAGESADTLALQDARLTYEARLTNGGDRLDLTAFTLETAPITLNASGAVTALASRPVLDLTVETGETNLAALADFVPAEALAGVRPQGTLQLSTRIAGPLPDSTQDAAGPNDRLRVNGTGRLAGIGVDVDGAAVLRDASADLSLSLDSVSVASIQGQLLGKPLSGRVDVTDLMGEPQLDGRLAGSADLAQLASMGVEEGAEPLDVSGSAEYDVAFTGPATDPDAIRLTGPLRLADVRLPTASLRAPLEIPTGTIRFTGTGVRIDEMPMRSGEQTMALQASVQRLFPISRGLADSNPALQATFTFTSDRLDLVALFPETPEDEVTYSQLFAAQLAGTRVNGRDPDAIAAERYGTVEIPAYTVDGRVEIATLLNDPQRLDDLTFDVAMADRRVALTDLRARTYGGRLSGSMTLDQSAAAASARRTPPGSRTSVLLASAGPAAAAPRAATSRATSRATSLDDDAIPTDVTYDFTLENAEAGAFLNDWTRLGRAVKGTLDFNVSGDSPMSRGLLPIAQALQAEGASIVADGGLSLNLPLVRALVDRLGVDAKTISDFKRFGGPFTIEQGELRMGEWAMSNPALDMAISGALGFGGAVDLQVDMDVPVGTLKGSGLASNAGLTSLLGRIGGDDERVSVGFGVDGTMGDPALALDREGLKASVQRLLPNARDAIRGIFNRN